MYKQNKGGMHLTQSKDPIGKVILDLRNFLEFFVKEYITDTSAFFCFNNIYLLCTFISEIFPSLTCKVKLIITFSSMSDGDLYEKKNCVSLKDCKKAGKIKNCNIAVS